MKRILLSSLLVLGLIGCGGGSGGNSSGTLKKDKADYNLKDEAVYNLLVIDTINLRECRQSEPCRGKTTGGGKYIEYETVSKNSKHHILTITNTNSSCFKKGTFDVLLKNNDTEMLINDFTFKIPMKDTAYVTHKSGESFTISQKYLVARDCNDVYDEVD